MTEERDIFLFGASGHGRVIFDLIQADGEFHVVCFADDNPALAGGIFCDLPVIGDREKLRRDFGTLTRGIVAIGDNRVRGRLARWFSESGCELQSARHPAAVIAGDVCVGAGTVAMACAVVNSGTIIGRNVILNTKSSIDHDCRIGDDVHIAPGSTLCGGVCVGDGAMVGAGATIIPNICVGPGSIVGAGAVVIHDVPAGATVVGNPARRIL